MSQGQGIWTQSQRRGLVAVITAALVYLLVKLLLNPTTIPDPQPPAGVLAAQLDNRIDPNQASEAELAAIPSLGEKRTAAIVEYRDRFVAQHPGRVAFSSLADLEVIKGIGAATAELMEPYLRFERGKR